MGSSPMVWLLWHNTKPHTCGEEKTRGNQSPRFPIVCHYTSTSALFNDTAFQIHWLQSQCESWKKARPPTRKIQGRQQGQKQEQQHFCAPAQCSSKSKTKTLLATCQQKASDKLKPTHLQFQSLQYSLQPQCLSSHKPTKSR